MYKIKLVLVYGIFTWRGINRGAFTKDVPMPVIPVKGWTLVDHLKDKMGHVVIEVKRVRYDPAEDIFWVKCTASLYDLCMIYVHNDGWKISGLDNFLSNFWVKDKITDIDGKEVDWRTGDRQPMAYIRRPL